MTVWATVRSHTAGDVDPPLDPGVPWVGCTLKAGLTRSGYGFLLVLAIALRLRVLLPTYAAVPSTWVVVLLALFAGGIAYLMSCTAVRKTARQADDRAPSLTMPLE